MCIKKILMHMTVLQNDEREIVCTDNRYVDDKR